MTAFGRCRLERWTRRLAMVGGLAMVAVWLPLFVAGIVSLRSRGPLGYSDALIVTGPNAYVRHPLYAGLSLTVVGLGLILGSRRLVVGGSGWVLMTRLWSVQEERGLAARFGPEYEAYRQATPALIPDPARFLQSLGRRSRRWSR